MSWPMMAASLLSEPVAFPENGPILVSKWWGAEDGQDLSLTQRKWRPLVKTLSDHKNGPQNGGVVFALCRSSFTAETKGPDGTVENFRFLNLTRKHSFLKDSSQCQDMRQVTNLKGLHYESVVEEAVFSNRTWPCSWKGTAATVAL